MSISAEDVQEMQAEIQRLKHELADLRMHYRMAITHEKLLEDELAVTRRVLELAVIELTDFSGSCPYDMFDKKIEDCDNGCINLDEIPECWRKYFIQQAREDITK